MNTLPASTSGAARRAISAARGHSPSPREVEANLAICPPASQSQAGPTGEAQAYTLATSTRSLPSKPSEATLRSIQQIGPEHIWSVLPVRLVYPKMADILDLPRLPRAARCGTRWCRCGLLGGRAGRTGGMRSRAEAYRFSYCINRVVQAAAISARQPAV